MSSNETSTDERIGANTNERDGKTGNDELAAEASSDERIGATEVLAHWINGEAATDVDETSEVVNPSTGKVHYRVMAGTAADVDRAVSAAAAAAPAWRALASAKRGRLLHALAEAIRENADSLVAMERADTGKPVATAKAEVEGAAAYFEFYAGLVNLPVGDVLDIQSDQHVFTRREPYGVIGVITPWNLPINQAARAIAPALVAGNVVVAKPAETTSSTTVELARLASKVGFDPGVINVVLGSGEVVGTAIVEHDLVRKVAFTGSVAVGRSIGRIAAERIIPLTLELGGKSANIVFADADLSRAVPDAVKAFTLNSGQVCSAGTRLLVQRDIYDDFVAAVGEQTAQLRLGEDVGPMITEQQYEQVGRYFDIAERDGARLVTGGPSAASDGDGFLVPATVYADVDNAMQIAREEIFGPVLVAIAFDDEQDAIDIANDSDYGLIASVWTADGSRALRVADALNTGQVFVNTWNTMAVQTPFGGHKNSGYGREKGIEAIHHYSHIKTVVVQI